MRVLVTGAGGQLGRELVPPAFAAGDDVVAADRRARSTSPIATPCSARSPTVAPRRRRARAAWTAVDACEADPDRAYRGERARRRATSPRPPAASAPTSSTCRPTTSSTAPRPTPYDEWDTPDPQSVYGASKLAGEHERRGRSRRDDRAHVVGVSASTAPTWSRRSCAWRPSTTTLRFVDDQRGHPTFSRRPARRSRAPPRGRAASAASTTSPTRARCRWYEFARAVLESAPGYDPTRVEPIATADLDPPRPAPPPGQLGARQRGRCGSAGSLASPTTASRSTASSRPSAREERRRAGQCGEEERGQDGEPGGAAARSARGTSHVVVLDYDGGDLTLDCLRSILASDWPADGSASSSSTTRRARRCIETIARELPAVEIVRNDGNRGFAGGVNVGLRRRGDADFVALVNNDATVDTRLAHAAGGHAGLRSAYRRRVPEDPLRHRRDRGRARRAHAPAGPRRRPRPRRAVQRARGSTVSTCGIAAQLGRGSGATSPCLPTRSAASGRAPWPACAWQSAAAPRLELRLAAAADPVTVTATSGTRSGAFEPSVPSRPGTRSPPTRRRWRW